MPGPREVLEYVARHMADQPESVSIEEDRLEEGSVNLRLSVAQDDMGKVIGRGGRTARAIRTVVRAAGAKAGVHAHVEIVE